MHELAITQNIVDLVSKAAQNRRVRRITIEVGALAGVMSDAIAFCFDEVAKGTHVEGAALDIRHIEGRVRCDDCGTELRAPDFLVRCSCGSTRLTWLEGQELNVKSMEIEELV
jgi:hydrogenase nickel incorporation protein HypA/HybF